MFELKAECEFNEVNPLGATALTFSADGPQSEKGLAATMGAAIKYIRNNKPGDTVEQKTFTLFKSLFTQYLSD